MWLRSLFTRIIKSNRSSPAYNQYFVDIPRESSVISRKDGYLELNFEVVREADGAADAVGSDIRLVF